MQSFNIIVRVLSSIAIEKLCLKSFACLESLHFALKPDENIGPLETYVISRKFKIRFQYVQSVVKSSGLIYQHVATTTGHRMPKFERDALL